MSNKAEKCVMVIDSELPTGVIANTSAILGMTLGKRFPEQVGNDVTDASEKTHLGIITVPVPILKGSREMLKKLRENLYNTEFNDLTVVDFSDVAQAASRTTNIFPKRQKSRKRITHIWESQFTGTRKKSTNSQDPCPF